MYKSGGIIDVPVKIKSGGAKDLVLGPKGRLILSVATKTNLGKEKRVRATQTFLKALME